MLYQNKQYTNDFVIGASGIRTHDPLGTANFDSCINENVGKSFNVLHVLSSLNEKDWKNFQRQDDEKTDMTDNKNEWEFIPRSRVLLSPE